jgi:hypothetical protein
MHLERVTLRVKGAATHLFHTALLNSVSRKTEPKKTSKNRKNDDENTWKHKSR